MHPKGNLYLVALILVLVGALNWGLIALNGTNVVTAASSAVISDMQTNAMVVRIVYALVGLAALFVIYKELPMN